MPATSKRKEQDQAKTDNDEIERNRRVYCRNLEGERTRTES